MPRADPDLGGDDWPPIHQHALLHRRRDFRHRTAMDQRRVVPGDPVPRVSETMHRLTVVREQQEAGRHHVQAAHVGEARGIADEVEDRSATGLVIRGGHHPERLVEREPAPLLCLNPPAVDRDLLPLRVHLGPERGDRTVDPNPPFLDQPFRGTPRRHPGLRQGALEPHLGHDSAGT